MAPLSAEHAWSELMEGNRRFVRNTPQSRNLAAERVAVARQQHPRAVVLTCADSRLVPEIIFDQKLGDLFVIRGAGNTADALALGSMEFAVEVLAVKLIVVLGHKRCGAVALAASGAKSGSANVKAITRRIRPAVEQANGDGDDRLRSAERLNVAMAARDVLERSPMLHERSRQGSVTVIEAYYDLDSGEVERLR